MDLEQRVKALEQEVQILKAQIQATLLDIQEQLLNGAYPSLRADDLTPPDRPLESANGHGPAPAEETRGAAPAEDEAEATRPRPTVQRFSLDEDEATRPANGTSAPPDPDVDWETLSRMEDWARTKIEQIGAERTRNLIALHVEESHLSPQQGETLLRFVALHGEEPATPPPISRRAVLEGSRRSASPPLPLAEPELEPDLESEAVEDPGETDSQFRNVVLKLIAGIHNAGVNKRWNRNHG